MLFSSLVFIICFLPSVLLIYYTLLRKSRKAQNYFLFFASLFFYAWGEPRFVCILIISIAGNFLFGIGVDKFKTNEKVSKLIIIFMLLFNLTIIFIFKYLMFTLTNINSFFGTDFTIHKVMLPIGISFFTFHAISYVIDIYRGKAAVQKNLWNVGLYIVFFPQLVAGPILRFEVISEQIMGRKETFDDFSKGVCRFLTGFGKKIILANNFALIADKAFSIPGDELTFSFAWLGAIAYTLQIYFDFSGYSDMAIGLGRMFGFRFPENFNYPYISRSTSEFWRRWHISLGTWFRDYVYIPLGGSRLEARWRIVLNLFIVWFLTGLWHGANWTFIFWGLFYFISISIEKLTKFEDCGSDTLLIITGKRIYTLLMVIFGWVLFRAETAGSAISYLKTMLFVNGTQLLDSNAIVYFTENKFLLVLGIVFSTPISKVISGWIDEKYKEGNTLPFRAATVLAPFTLMIIFLIAMSYLVKGSYNPFIYFNF